MSVSGGIGFGLELYAAVGIVTALAFVSFGIARVLPHPMPVSVGARPHCAGCRVAVALHSHPLAAGAEPRMTRTHRSLHRIVLPIPLGIPSAI
jgi:hypothetical protein